MSDSQVAQIESTQNTKYKLWRKYATFSEAEDCPWVPVEGWVKLSELASDQALELLLFSQDDHPALPGLLRRSRSVFRIPDRLMKGISSVQSPQGVLGFFPKPRWQDSDLTSHVLYLDRLQDPGNLGTIFRTAAATGIFSLVTAPGTVSCFNSKVIRASAGYLFSVPFLQGLELEWLSSRGYQLWAAAPRAPETLFSADFHPPLAVVIGNEGHGFESSNHCIAARGVRIPMDARVESLNAGISASLVMYELLRRTSSS